LGSGNCEIKSFGISNNAYSLIRHIALFHRITIFYNFNQQLHSDSEVTMTLFKRSSSLFLIVLVSLFSGVLTGCSAKAQAANDSAGLAMAPMSGMPDEVKSAPVTVQQAYQYAVANPDVLKQIPCYCGCGAAGHTSNYSCYVTDVDSSGKPNFDQHALGCSTCVDITQDVMRLQKQKKPLPEIRAYIDSTYSKYGPSNMSSSSSILPVKAISSTPALGCGSNSLSCKKK
jgi:hypothetical protein